MPFSNGATTSSTTTSTTTTRSTRSNPQPFQITIATVVMILTLLLGDAGVTLGSPTSSRLTRMPSFYGKRSHHSSGNDVISSRQSSSSSPNFGLDSIQLVPKMSDGQEEEGDGGEELGGYGFDSTNREDSLLKSLLLENNQRKRTSAGSKSSSSSSLSSSPSSSSSDAETEREMILMNGLMEVARYNGLLSEIVIALRKLQREMLEMLADDENENDERAEVEFVSKPRDHAAAAIGSLLRSSKRGTLARLPQFYGRRK